MQIHPNFSFDAHVNRLPFRNPNDPQRLREGAQLVGVHLQPVGQSLRVAKIASKRALRFAGHERV